MQRNYIDMVARKKSNIFNMIFVIHCILLYTNTDSVYLPVYDFTLAQLDVIHQYMRGKGKFN